MITVLKALGGILAFVPASLAYILTFAAGVVVLAFKEGWNDATNK